MSSSSTLSISSACSQLSFSASMMPLNTREPYHHRCLKLVFHRQATAVIVATSGSLNSRERKASDGGTKLGIWMVESGALEGKWAHHRDEAGEGWSWAQGTTMMKIQLRRHWRLSFVLVGERVPGGALSTDKGEWHSLETSMNNGGCFSNLTPILGEVILFLVNARVILTLLYYPSISHL